jgi:small subunit ribosomal protein S8
MDHIANLITSIRNAEMVRHSALTVPNSKLSRAVLDVLKERGMVTSYEAAERTIDITLPQPVSLHHYKRVSKSGRRIYTNSHTIPIVQRGFGSVIISTSEGVMSGQEARKRKIGGEILCEIY